ncbi:MAG: DUF6792 domain-containing protein [Pseudohongiella sp.]|uniref:DUF6792 domain-containing protein n=1 Tax=Pseudohongiella sp. TaxID=1979412 RepID=UPI0034A06086
MYSCSHQIKHRIFVLIWLLSSVALAGCGTLTTWRADHQYREKGNDSAEYKAEKDSKLQETAQLYGLMALLSEAVYRRDLSRDIRDDKGCAYVKADADTPTPEYGMPASHDERWKRWVPKPPANDLTPGNSTTPANACWDDESGLYYETYVLERDGKIVEAVIAFRGTENRPGQTFRDWRSNIAAFFGFEPEQYAAARQHLPTLIEALKKSFIEYDVKPVIYATGHSLGGGLAQQAGYMSPDILEVFTFNTSPITNWSQLALDGEVRNAYPIIHRVYHGGEFLENPRFVSTSATKARFGRHDVGVQLDVRSLVGGHSIQLIACEFARSILESGIDEAPHGYSSSWIRNVLLDNTRRNQPCSPKMAGA